MDFSDSTFHSGIIVSQKGVGEETRFLSISDQGSGFWRTVTVLLDFFHQAIVDHGIFYDSTGYLGVGWFEQFEGLVLDLIRLHNVEKAGNDCLYRLIRCLDLTWTNRGITGCDNPINQPQKPSSLRIYKACEILPHSIQAL